MSSGLDPNAVAGTALSDLISRTADVLFKAAANFATDLKTKLLEDFSTYMEECHRRNATVRLISQKDRDVPLYSVYVCPKFTCAGEILDDEEVIYKIREGTNIVVVGDGGAGKTFFMRHLWMTMFLNSSDMAPIFIELRHLNDCTDVDIQSFIKTTISKQRTMTDDLFLYFCNCGRFCFIFDGFDEIIQRHKDAIQKQILDMAGAYPNSRFVVSSRHDNRFSGWQGFSVFETKPFEIEQTRELVEKVPFDQIAKELFTNRLTDSFYLKHTSFLSNPLLTILMMMTFKDNMNIPSQMTIFYDHAFTTLYQWHDATKAYNRQKSLNILEFQRSFGIFCLLSYVKEKLEFSETEAISFIESSSEVCGIEKDAQSILTDYKESVNLLRLEGFKYVFIHRSFQEYFCSYAMVHIVRDQFKNIVDSIQHRYGDNTISMAFEMEPSIVVSSFIEPLLRSINLHKNHQGDRSERFMWLSKSEAKIEFMIGREPDSDRLWIAVGHDADAKILSLLHNVGRIMGRRSNVFVSAELFDAANLAAEDSGFNVSGSIHMTFTPNDVEISADLDEADRQQEMQLEQKLKKYFMQDPTILDRIEEALSKEIDIVSKWCRREVAKKDNQGVVLRRSLGLSIVGG